MKKIFFFLMLVFTAGFTQLAEARLSCMPPARSGLSTDSCTDRDYQNNLCIVEPLATQEVSGASLCVLGKFRMPAHLRNLVDMVVTYQLDGTPSVSGTLPVSFSTAEMAEARRTGEFMTNLTLPRVGHYTVMVRARMLNDMGTFVDLIFPSPSGSRVARVEPPETSVAVNNIRYRFGNSTASNCSMMTDPGCFQVMRRAGTDGMMTNRFGVTAPSATPPVTDATTNPPTRASNVSSVDICVGSAPGSVAGSFSDVRATNTITDRSQTTSRVVTVAKNCDQEGAMCRASASDFCPGGSTVSVPVGHGENQITLAISTRAGMATLQVEPFTIDLKGPDLCVRYYDVRNPERPRLLENVDGRVLLASETDSIKVDVSLKSCAASGAPESVSVAHAPKACDAANPPTATNLSACLSMSPICMQRNNEKEETGADRYVALCPASSGKQQSYQAFFVTPSFPMNTVSLKSRDDLFNINTETHYFAYGDVRPLYDTRTGHEGEFSDAQLQRAMVTKGFGSFLPASFLRGEVKDALLEVLNSPKFKEDFFPKLLEPHKPIPQEVECLRNIQEPLNCELNHLMGGDRNRVVAIKPFNNDWTSARATRTSNDPTGFRVGSIEIPTMTFFENNLLRLQVRINGMHGRAEMYTIEPQNTDRNQGDGLVDFEDDDADNDGICDSNSKILLVCDDDDHNFICDEEMGLTGSQGKGLAGNPGHCRLDTSIPRNRCPDMRNVDSTIPYPGCSDQDDDNDGFVDDQDTKGRLVDDPDFGDHKAGTPTIIPVMFTTNTVMLNLDLRIRYENGLMKFDVLPINVKGMDMVGIAPDKGTDWPINFDCSKTVSEIYQGGLRGDPGNGQYVDLINSGSQDVCLGLQDLNEVAAYVGFTNEQMYHRKDQNTMKQLDCTFNAILRCSVPRQLEDTLNSYESREILTLSPKLLGKKFNMSFYSPLARTQVTLDQRGVGVTGNALLLPAGVTDEHQNAPGDGKDFMRRLMEDHGDLFPRGSLTKFGPVSRPPQIRLIGRDARDPIGAARSMNDEVNLSLSEETINSLLHSVGLEMWDFSQTEAGRRFLDLSTQKIREDFNLSIPDMNSAACLDEYDHEVSESSWECFNFALNVSNLFSDKLSYIDFFGEGNQVLNGKQPLILGNTLSPLLAPTVKLVDLVPLEMTNADGSPAPVEIYNAELEIGVGGAQMDVYEEAVTRDKMGRRSGTNTIRSWCERFPASNPERCDRHEIVPMISYKVAGKVSVSMLLHVGEQGLLYAEGGISSKQECGEGIAPPCLDKSKTRLDFTVVENNTIVPDYDMSEKMRAQVETILGKYLYATERAINFNVPLQMPLKDFCAIPRRAEHTPKICNCLSEHPDPTNSSCDMVDTIQNAWKGLQIEDYGIEGLEIDPPSFGLSSDIVGSPYLTIGAGVNFHLSGR